MHTLHLSNSNAAPALLRMTLVAFAHSPAMAGDLPTIDNELNLDNLARAIEGQVTAIGNDGDLRYDLTHVNGRRVGIIALIRNPREIQFEVAEDAPWVEHFRPSPEDPDNALELLHAAARVFDFVGAYGWTERAVRDQLRKEHEQKVRDATKAREALDSPDPDVDENQYDEGDSDGVEEDSE